MGGQELKPEGNLEIEFKVGDNEVWKKIGDWVIGNEEILEFQTKSINKTQTKSVRQEISQLKFKEISERDEDISEKVRPKEAVKETLDSTDSDAMMDAEDEPVENVDQENFRKLPPDKPENFANEPA